jgi:hypothetical protein
MKPEWTSMRGIQPTRVTGAESDIFKAYVQWLYSHHIDDATHDSEKWVKMYVLGERFMDEVFQDDILKLMMCDCVEKNKYPVGPQINTVYEGTPEGSPARRLLVDFFVWAADKAWVKDRKFAESMPLEFINDVILALVDQRPGLVVSKGASSQPWVKNPEQYMLCSQGSEVTMGSVKRRHGVPEEKTG